VPDVTIPARQHRKSAAFAVLAAALASFAQGACNDYEGVQLCGEIPQGGCPSGRGGTCDDVVCAGLYDCVEGDWTEVEHCDGNPTTVASSGAGTGGFGGGDGAGGCAVPEIDHTGEVDGCTPDLLEPDCPAVAAETCTPCETGCADFFLCTADGWVDVGACAADGTFVYIFR
jgi:hypothetical protein